MSATTTCGTDRVAAFLGRHGGSDLGPVDPLALAGYRARSDARLLVVGGDADDGVGAAVGGDVEAVVALRCRPDLASGGRVAVVDVLVVAPHVDDGPVLAAVERAAAELGCGRIEGRVGLSIGPGTTLVERFVRAACVAAEEIVALIDGLRERPDVGIGADGAATKAADRAAEERALDRLGPLAVPICSEERGHVGGRPEPEGRWIAVDPIDGTRNYVRDLAPHAFAAGLVEAGEPVAGVVVDLTSGRRWIGRRGGGATVDGRRCIPRPGGPVAVPSVAPGDDTGPLPDGHSRVRMSGSTTIDLCRVADGALGAFVDRRRHVVHVHDLAGPLAILDEAGVDVATHDGGRPALPPDPRWTTGLVVTARPRSVADG